MAFTTDQLDQLHQWYGGGNLNPNSTINIGGNTYGVTGVSHNDEGGYSFTPDSLIQYDPTQITNPGYQYNVIDPNTGNVSFQRSVMDGGSTNLSDFKDLGQAVAVLGSMYLGGQGLAAMGAGSAGGIGGSGFAAGAGDIGTSLGTAEGVGVGSSTGINGMDALSDLATTSGTVPAGAINAGVNTGSVLEGAASGLDGVGDYGPAPDPYDPSTMPTEADVGGGPVPDVTDPNYVNGSDMQSDIATQTGTAPPGAVNEGTSTPWTPGENGVPNNPTGTPTTPTGSPPAPGGGNNGSGSGLNLGSLLQLLTGVYGMNQQNNSANNMLDYLKERQGINDNMYKPGSSEYNALWDEMSRKDAAAGRNSQYGPRSVDLAARIAQLKMDANTKLTSGIANNMATAYNARANSGTNLSALVGNLLNSGSSGNNSGSGISLSDLTKWASSVFND
jgi:hypothetical protein